MSQSDVATEQRSSYVSYFSRNNIEFDIVRVCFSANARSRSAFREQIDRYSSFRYVNDNILRKCSSNGFIDQPQAGQYVLTLNGALAYLYVVENLTKRITITPKSGECVADEMLKDGVLLGGLGNDSISHRSIVQHTLQDLLRLNILMVDSGRYVLASLKERNEKVGEAAVGLFSLLSLKKRERKYVDHLFSTLVEVFHLEDFSPKSLIEIATEKRKFQAARLLAENLSRREMSIEWIIHQEKLDAIENSDKLHQAALTYLESHFKEHDSEREKTLSEAWIALAIFCKNTGLTVRAKELYYDAYKILGRYPQHERSAKVQLANSLECDRRVRLLKGDYQGAIQSCGEQEAIWKELGEYKQVTFCQCNKLQILSVSAEDMGDCAKASNLMRQCSELASHSKTGKQWYLAKSSELEGKYYERLGKHYEASNAYEKTAEYYREIGRVFFADKALGQAHQARAIAFKEDPRCSFDNIANEFGLAKEKYELAQCEEAARICESDYHKYKGLSAKNEGKYSDALQHFDQGRQIYQHMANIFSQRCERYLVSAKWFAGAILETEAQDAMLSLIQKRESLTEVIGQLRKAGNIFAELGDDKHAHIDYCLSIISMAIDHFHSDRISEASRILSGAKEQLPPDFGQVILGTQVNKQWNPLRYAMDSIEQFNKYTRRIETEKGFSFESRVRELIKREYSSYDDVEEKNFIPEEDEVGIVFQDRSTIEIDAFGMRKEQERILLLAAETKNTNALVDIDAIGLFEKKTRFLGHRYSKIAKLDSLKGVDIEIRLFVSRSGFTPRAEERARAQGIVTYEKDSLNKMLEKHGMRTMRIA